MVQEYSVQDPTGQEYFEHSNSVPMTHEYVDQNMSSYAPTFQVGTPDSEQTKLYCGVDGSGEPGCTGGPSWRKQQLIPFESYGAGEYIGPSRTPHVNAYRLRVDDQIEFVCLLYTSDAADE